MVVSNYSSRELFDILSKKIITPKNSKTKFSKEELKRDFINYKTITDFKLNI